MNNKIIIWVAVISFILFTIMYAVKKSSNPIKKATTTVASGIIALIAVNTAGVFTGVYIPISILSVCVSLAGGIPGVTAMLIIDTFF
ncbi:MAG: pro-sigmaK processing inhibitor BofA family protein [Acutalibacteraceae bacterium]